MTVIAATANQRYHLILADIAMAAAIRTYDKGYIFYTGSAGYLPGSIRDLWLADTADERLRKRVTAMANAGLVSLQSLPPEKLAQMAVAQGVPVDKELAGLISGHFDDKRESWLSYTR